VCTTLQNQGLLDLTQIAIGKRTGVRRICRMYVWISAHKPTLLSQLQILYMYKSPQEREQFWKRASKPAPKYNGNDIVYEKWPVPGKKPGKLLDYPHLPDRIGTNEYWWVFEAWRRLDPRITNRRDAMMVSWTLQGEGLKKSNERKRVHIYASLNARDKPSGNSEGVLAKDKPASKTQAKKKTIKPSDMVTPLMTDAQKAANTTRGLTPGLINKDLGEVPGNRVPWPDKSKLAGHHHVKKSRRAGRSKGIGSRGGQARQSQGLSTQQPLDVEDSATLEVDEVSLLVHFHEDFFDLEALQDTVSDDGTELASEQSSESTELEEASGEESLEHSDAPSGDQTDEDSQAEAEMPPKNLRLWVQPAPPQALQGITASHGAVPSRGEPSWSYSVPPRAEMEPNYDNDGSNLGSFLSNVPALDLATQSHSTAPLPSAHGFNGTQRQASSHQNRLAFPLMNVGPTHPFYIPPRGTNAASDQTSCALNPQAAAFVPQEAQTMDYRTVSPAAGVPYQQASSTNTFDHGNGNEQVAATAGPPTTISAPMPPRITDHVRLTCPDDLTPSRWADFLEFCVTHGIGRQHHSLNQPAPEASNQTSSRGHQNYDGQPEWTTQDEQDEEWGRSFRQ
ncbi:MAG: hypothetical protein Q9192_007761, partial [Flavoplaca navasiana]